ncbi:DUF1835 domain-containing protein [Echinicola strongylocentroti]|uniref:DUF1835 domain-containing protein n=1 Tax=Echinicola strongylocentroti TaxID=1795355 RepID=A0A2Z4IEP3_9BACT|nr:DUF1835 domain-containing protein [Echinicola strongylocentroti]AWW29137.1 DUF1835 domain-containing protein [Echinicola strongylocentroti]
MTPIEGQYHILNGDALKDRFPKEVAGEVIVMRECLIDGEVKSENLKDFFAKRAAFIADAYGGFSEEDYYRKTVAELEKISSIPPGSSIYLWFEEDLFCQVNFWFVVNLLLNQIPQCKVYLVRPKTSLFLGFAGLDQKGLQKAFEDRMEIKQVAKIAQLWDRYQANDCELLWQGARELEDVFPFILTAVEAHLARIPKGDHLGRPKEALLEIMKELGTKEFVPVFKEFHKRESIYGFGDLQVKRLFDEI